MVDKGMWVYVVTGDKVPMQYFIWVTGELFSISTVSIMSIFKDNSWPLVTAIFALITILDLIDFSMTGNSVWWYLGSIPICMNTTGMGIFISGLIIETWKTRVRLIAF
jgi:hypothetical protein